MLLACEIVTLHFYDIIRGHQKGTIEDETRYIVCAGRMATQEGGAAPGADLFLHDFQV